MTREEFAFSVEPGRGYYYCFDCGNGGDAIRLVASLKSKTFIEATDYLIEHYT